VQIRYVTQGALPEDVKPREKMIGKRKERE
jgi:hypothetical protein